MVEYGKQKVVEKSGFAGGQSSGGYKLPMGGSIFFVEEGGPTASASFSFEHGSITVSFHFGTTRSSGGVGVSIPVPRKDRFYKLWVTHRQTIVPYASYKRTSPGGAWVKQYTGYTLKSTQSIPILKEVGR